MNLMSLNSLNSAKELIDANHLTHRLQITTSIPKALPDFFQSMRTSQKYVGSLTNV